MRDKSERIESIHLLNVQASVVERQKKKFCNPSLSFGERRHSYNTFVSLRLNSQKKLAKGHVEDLELTSDILDVKSYSILVFFQLV